MQSNHRKSTLLDMPKSTIELITDYYAENLKELRMYANKILDDIEQSKDVVQQCFINLLEMEQPIIPQSLPALIHGMIRNGAICVVRRRNVIREYNKKETASASMMTEHLETRIVAKDIAMQAERLIDKLPCDCHRIYEMNLYEGMKIAEIASALNLKYKYAEKKLGKARKIVRQGLRNVV